MQKGKIIKWLVSPGDEVESGEILFEISTTQLTEDPEQGVIVMEVESQEDGWLAKVLVEAGEDEVSVGTPLAYVCDDEDAMAAFGSLEGKGPDSGKMFTWQAFTKSKVFAECGGGGGGDKDSAKTIEDLAHLNYKPINR